MISFYYYGLWFGIATGLDLDYGIGRLLGTELSGRQLVLGSVLVFSRSADR